LPDPEDFGMQSGEEHVTPGTNTEKELVKIWEEVLGKTQIGVQTSFFNLGGNSLKIIKMSQMVNQKFGVSFSIDKFFEYLTIRDIARVIEQEKIMQDEIKFAEKEIELMTF
jgi:acyl carrier protein